MEEVRYFMTNGSIDWKVVLDALTSNGFLTAIISSIAIIVLGFVLARTKFLPDNFDKSLNKLVLFICLPCLIFCSFMMPITHETFMNSIFAFGYGFVIYTTMVLISKVMFRWVKDLNKRTVFEIMFVFGSTNFFGQPIMNAIEPEAFKLSNIYNVANLIFVFSYAYYSICVSNPKKIEAAKSKDKRQGAKELTAPTLSIKDVIKKVFKNPIIIATIVGFFFWIMQLIGDKGWWMVPNQNEDLKLDSIAFWMINGSCVPVFKTLKLVGDLSSPLIWISIGMILGKSNIKESAKDKFAWVYAGLKIIIAPLINFLLLLAIRQIPVLGEHVTYYLVFATTIMWATPTATVIISYCVTANKEPQFASRSYLVSTILGVVMMPVWIIVLKIVETAGIFIK